MMNIFLVVQVIISVFLIGSIIIQKDSSDSLSGLSGANNNSIPTSKAAENLLTSITKYLATAFIINSLILGNLAVREGKETSLIHKIEKHGNKNQTVPTGD